MWFVIIMIVVVAMVVGPIMMMRPSPAQKHTEQLRAAALAQGIGVSVRNLPQQATEIEKPAAVPVYFFPPVNHHLKDDWFLLRTHYAHDMHFLNWWAWQGEWRATDNEQAVLREYLPLLPESVRGISLGSKGVCIYWQEQGGLVALQQIIKLLEVLNALQIRAK
jgi:hypothetical protein